jgi:hypothetical protein
VKLTHVYLASALVLAAGPALAMEQGKPLPRPAPGQVNGYIVPTIDRNLNLGTQAGGSYTTSGGTTYHGYINGNARGAEGGASVAIPCGRLCGN